MQERHRGRHRGMGVGVVQRGMSHWVCMLAGSGVTVSPAGREASVLHSSWHPYLLLLLLLLLLLTGTFCHIPAHQAAWMCPWPEPGLCWAPAAAGCDCCAGVVQTAAPWLLLLLLLPGAGDLSGTACCC
jgi:hypothetical protein